MRKDRLRQLERRAGAQDAPRIVVCWCNRDDNQHDAGCPVLELEAEGADILRIKHVDWPDDGKEN